MEFDGYTEDLEKVIRMANSHGNERSKSEIETNINNNSLSARGAKPVTSKKGRKKVKKNKFKNSAISLMLVAGIIVGSYSLVTHGKEHFEREQALEDANNYMSTKIVYYLEKADVDYTILDNKNIVIEDDIEKLSVLCKVMENDGFTRDETYYAISKACGNDAFDKIVQTDGYENKDDFLMKNYFSGTLSSSGESYLTKKPDESKFENNVQVGYVECVEELKEASKILTEKGLSK